MAEIEQTPDLITGDDIGANAIDHTALSPSFINVTSGDPSAANDTGQGYVVGGLWINSTSGDVFQAISVSAEDASWANQEGDDVNPPFKVQGATSGFSHTWSSPGAYPGAIDAISFSSDGNATDHGEGGVGSYTSKGVTRDSTHNYHMGMSNSPQPGAYKSSYYRWSFTAPATLEDIGEHTLAPSHTTAIGSTASATNGTLGFIMGGLAQSPTVIIDHVEKFTFASPTTATDTGGELTSNRGDLGGNSDVDGGYMYAVGGYSLYTPQTNGNIIERGAFTISSGTFTDWGDLSSTTDSSGMTGTATHGYRHGGTPSTNVIENYPYSSPSNTSDVGDLTESVGWCGGCSSTTHGYRTGGDSSNNTIDKYSFPAGGNATDVGNLTSDSNGGVGAEI